MASPFPGMDPYLEARWRDVRTKLVAYVADLLNTLLPKDLIARTEERIGIEADTADLPPGISPDVAVLETAGVGAAYGQTGSGRQLAQFRLVATVPETITHRWVEIREEPGEKLVTVIELISPTNKTPRRLKSFVKKRKSLLASGVNVVEIDLNRSGDWRRMLLPQRPPRGATAAYRAVIRVAAEPGIAYLEPIDIRKPLPELPIPLRDSEPPVKLPLQPLIEQAYRNGRYAQTIDYSNPPAPPLCEDYAAWADALLRSAGKR